MYTLPQDRYSVADNANGANTSYTYMSGQVSDWNDAQSPKP